MFKYIKTLFNLSIDNNNTPYKLAGFVIVGWLLCLILVMVFINSDPPNGWATRGQFGDLFGSINALFSGLAFAGIIYSIMQQQKELGLTRDDLELTRDELKLNREEQVLNRKEFETQNDILYLQRFDNTFFNMLSLHHQLTASMMYQQETSLKGISLLKYIIDSMNSNLTPMNKLFYVEEFYEYYQNEYNRHIDQFLPYLSPYLQSLASIYITIKGSDLINESDRQYYFKILKSYISSAERRFLYYHLVLVGTKDETIQSLIEMEEDLKIISTIDSNLFLHSSHHALLSKMKVT